jgi:hypothetical protein
VNAVSDNSLTVDLLESGAWIRDQRLAAPSDRPMLAVGRSLRSLGVPDSAVISFRKLGQIVHSARLDFLLREHADKAVTP